MRDGVREGGHGVLEGLELFNVGVGQQVLPGGEHLPQLDVGRAEADQGAAQLLGPPSVGRVLARLVVVRAQPEGRNALRALSGRPPRAFPAAASPTVVAVSLHRRSGILQLNRLVLTGLLAAGMKALVEACVLGSVSGSRLAGWAMVLMERIAFLLGRVVPPPRKES